MHNSEAEILFVELSANIMDEEQELHPGSQESHALQTPKYI